MYPTLFEIADFRVDTYSVVWFIALSLAIVWVVHRLEQYEINEDTARKIMCVSFLFMLAGARAPEYIKNWRMYLNQPSLFLSSNGGLHESGAILGAFISSFILCLLNRKKISFLKLCEAAAPPMMLSIAVGRWGCFLNGCCVGLPTKFFAGVHFPFDKAGLMRHPVQIYYSLMALVIVAVLLSVEKFLSKRYELSKSHSILTPLTLIFYSLMRLSLDMTRISGSLLWKISNYWLYMMLTWGLPIEILWLSYGLIRLKKIKLS